MYQSRSSVLYDVLIMLLCDAVCLFFFECYGDHRDLHVLTHSFPTRRSSDLYPDRSGGLGGVRFGLALLDLLDAGDRAGRAGGRSEEHTSELQSLMRISYAVFCLKKKTIIVKTEVINQDPHSQLVYTLLMADMIKLKSSDNADRQAQDE